MLWKVSSVLNFSLGEAVDETNDKTERKQRDNYVERTRGLQTV